MSEPERVTVTLTGGVADVRLNRPEKLNALDQAMILGLVETADRLANDRSVRAVVLSGEGRAFCAGLDLSLFQARDADATRLLAGRIEGRATNLVQQAARAWTDLTMPVIAAVHGHALGGGLQIALGADIRIVSPGARLSVLEIRWGLVPDMTGTYTLRQLVRLDVAKELTWTGRMVSGEEAVGIGLATSLSDTPREAALELARLLAGQSPDAVAAAKRLLNQSGDVPAPRQFLDESEEVASLIGSPNQREAVHAFLEGREPSFVDPR